MTVKQTQECESSNSVGYQLIKNVHFKQTTLMSRTKNTQAYCSPNTRMLQNHVKFRVYYNKIIRQVNASLHTLQCAQLKPCIKDVTFLLKYLIKQ